MQGRCMYGVRFLDLTTIILHSHVHQWACERPRAADLYPLFRLTPSVYAWYPMSYVACARL